MKDAAPTIFLDLRIRKFTSSMVHKLAKGDSRVA
jgi:hypothetical protein